MPILSLAQTAISFVNAQVLGPDGIVAERLRIVGGQVAEIGGTPRRGDRIVALDGSVVLPGLINAHDHLELNNFPRLKWQERYANASEWIADFQPRFATDPRLTGPRAVPLAERLLIGALKNLLAGATTVCHHNPLHRPMRRRYPVRLVTRFRFSHSFLIDGESLATDYRRTPQNWPWIVHLAEGTDAAAAAELPRLEQLRCLGPNTLLVHGVALTPPDQERILECGGGLIWCPSSNLFTLGATADVRRFAAVHRVALGSDSRLSGERDLLDELHVASQTGQISGAELYRMVTLNAADLLRIPSLGRLAPSLPADLVILPPSDRPPLETLLAARRADLRLVMLAGRPLVTDPDFAPLFAATGRKFTAVRLDGREKLLAREIADRLRHGTIGEEGLELVEG